MQPLWKTYGNTSKIKNGTVLWPNNSTSGNLSEEIQETNLKEYMHTYAHGSILYNSQDLEAAQVSISRWVDKKAAVHLHNGILCSRKTEGIPTLCDSIDRN